MLINIALLVCSNVVSLTVGWVLCALAVFSLMCACVSVCAANQPAIKRYMGIQHANPINSALSNSRHDGGDDADDAHTHTAGPQHLHSICTNACEMYWRVLGAQRTHFMTTHMF